MAAEDNKARVRALVAELWNRGEVAAVERYFAGERLRSEIARHHAELLAAFSDFRVTIDGLVAEGDTVAARLTLEGTHDRGPFAGRPPSGARVTWRSFRFYRLEGDKVVETWAVQDRLGLMEQLGSASADDAVVHWADGSAS